MKNILKAAAENTIYYLQGNNESNDCGVCIRNHESQMEVEQHFFFFFLEQHFLSTTKII